MVDDEHDRGFAALPPSLRARIDAAFDSALRGTSSGEEPARKRRRLEAAPQPGGFIAEDTAPGGFLPEEQAAGGFLVDEPLESDSPASGEFLANDDDDDASDSQRRSQIPLSLIPTALQILDLPPDDEDVLSVFRNAAAGWEGRGRTPSGRGEEEAAFVSRKDWRAVCAAVLDTAAADDGEVDMEDDAAERGQSARAETSSDLSEEYVGTGEDESEGEEEDSDDEYRERGGGFAGSKKTKAGPKATIGTPTTKARRGRKTRTTSESDEGDEAERGLTGSRKEECRAAFALFFPDVPDEEVEMQRIRIKDITRVARLLKEKITAEETVEMLEAFSTASDQSMSLCDFERMMVAAKLV